MSDQMIKYGIAHMPQPRLATEEQVAEEREQIDLLAVAYKEIQEKYEHLEARVIGVGTRATSSDERIDALEKRMAVAVKRIDFLDADDTADDNAEKLEAHLDRIAALEQRVAQLADSMGVIAEGQGEQDARIAAVVSRETGKLRLDQRIVDMGHRTQAEFESLKARIAVLEKQAEGADKRIAALEPKYKVGDVVLANGGAGQEVVGVDPGHQYTLRAATGIESRCSERNLSPVPEEPQTLAEKLRAAIANERVSSELSVQHAMDRLEALLDGDE